MANESPKSKEKKQSVILTPAFKRIYRHLHYERLQKKDGKLYAMYCLIGPPGCGKSTFADSFLIPLFEKSLKVTLTPETDEDRSRGTHQYASDPQNNGAITFGFKLSSIMAFLSSGKKTDRKLLLIDEGQMPKNSTIFWDSFRSLYSGTVENATELQSYPILGSLTLVILMNERPDGPIFAPAFIDRLYRTYYLNQPEPEALVTMCQVFSEQTICPDHFKTRIFLERLVVVLTASVPNTFGLPQVSIRNFEAFFANLEVVTQVDGLIDTQEILQESIRLTFDALPRLNSSGVTKSYDYSKIVSELFA